MQPLIQGHPLKIKPCIDIYQHMCMYIIKLDSPPIKGNPKWT